ncbi:Kinesin light chain 3 [Chytriomyces hyalinus]|nr:Kinesin light chain 3 [Chytriomyces hyalinus]
MPHSKTTTTTRTVHTTVAAGRRKETVTETVRVVYEKCLTSPLANEIAAPKESIHDPDAGLDMDIRGVRLSFLFQYVNDCGGRDALAEMTTADMSVKFVKPATESSRLSLCSQLHQAHLDKHSNRDQKDPNDDDVTADAEWFISHAWKYKFLDVVDALQEFFIWERKMDPDSVIIWFDLFSNSQHDTATKPFTFWTDVFMGAIKAMKNVVMVLAPWSDPIPLTRAWCIFELYSCLKTESNFHVAMTNQETKSFLAALQYDGYELHRILGRIRCSKAEAGQPSDRDQIFRVVELQVVGGFPNLDRMVFSVFLKWATDKLKWQVENAESERNRGNWAVALGSFLKHLEKSDEAIVWLEEGLELQRRTVGPEEVSTLATEATLGSLYQEMGDTEKAGDILNHCYSIKLAQVGPDDPSIFGMMNNLAQVYRVKGEFSKASELLTTLLATAERVSGRENEFYIRVYANYVSLLCKQGRLQEAKECGVLMLELSERALEENHPDRILALNNYGAVLVELREWDAAEAVLKDALTRSKRNLGEDCGLAISQTVSLSSIYRDKGELGKSLEYLDAAIESQTRSAFLGSFRLFQIQMGKAALLIEMGRVQDALDLSKQVYSNALLLFGPSDYRTCNLAPPLASVTSLLGDHKAAVDILEQNLEHVRAILGPSHLETLNMMNQLAVIYLQDLKDTEKAGQVIDMALRESTLDPANPLMLSLQLTKGALYSDLKQLSEAVRHNEAMVEIAEGAYGRSSQHTIQFLNNLAFAHLKLSEFDTAESIFTEIIQTHIQVYGELHQNTLTSMINICKVYKEQGNFTKEIEQETAVLQKYKATIGEDHPNTLRLLMLLASSHAAANDLDASLAYLSECAEKRYQVLGPLHPDTEDSVECLQRLYTKTNELEKGLAVCKKYLGETHEKTIYALHLVGMRHMREGNADLAERYLLEEVEGWRKAGNLEDVNYLNALNNLAALYINLMKNTEKALPLLREMSYMWFKLDPTSPSTSMACDTYYQVGMAQKAYLEVREGMTLFYGVASQKAVNAGLNQCLEWVRRKEFQLLKDFCVGAIADLEELKSDQYSMMFKRQLVDGLIGLKEFDEAEVVASECFNAVVAADGITGGWTAMCLYSLGSVKTASGKFLEAAELYVNHLAQLKALNVVGKDNELILKFLLKIYLEHESAGQIEAVERAHEYVSLIKTLYGSQSTQILEAMDQLERILQMYSPLNANQEMTEAWKSILSALQEENQLVTGTGLAVMSTLSERYKATREFESSEDVLNLFLGAAAKMLGPAHPACQKIFGSLLELYQDMMSSGLLDMDGMRAKLSNVTRISGIELARLYGFIIPDNRYDDYTLVLSTSPYAPFFSHKAEIYQDVGIPLDSNFQLTRKEPLPVAVLQYLRILGLVV